MLDLKLLESFLTWVQNINHARIAEKTTVVLLCERFGGWPTNRARDKYKRDKTKGNPFKCHEKVLCLQPLIPPKRFDISPSLTGGCSEGLGAFCFSLKTIVAKK